MKFEGPTLRQRNAPTTEESSICAEAGVAKARAVATPTAAVTRRGPCITNPAEWGDESMEDDITVTMGRKRALTPASSPGRHPERSEGRFFPKAVELARTHSDP